MTVLFKVSFFSVRLTVCSSLKTDLFYIDMNHSLCLFTMAIFAMLLYHFKDKPPTSSTRIKTQEVGDITKEELRSKQTN